MFYLGKMSYRWWLSPLYVTLHEGNYTRSCRNCLMYSPYQSKHLFRKKCWYQECTFGLLFFLALTLAKSSMLWSWFSLGPLNFSIALHEHIRWFVMVPCWKSVWVFLRFPCESGKHPQEILWGLHVFPSVKNDMCRSDVFCGQIEWTCSNPALK